MWQCELIPEKESPLMVKNGIWRAGAMWYASFLLEDNLDSKLQFYRDYILSEEYLSEWREKRPPLFILLPCGDYWNVDARRIGLPGMPGWTTKGMPPNITALPFISCIGHYEGWLMSGTLSEDMKHRSYPELIHGVAS